MNKKIRPGTYEHYKGQPYEVLGVARYSESREDMVVYRRLSGDDSLWVRPVKMFLESVTVDNRIVPRFRFIESKH
ncbi:MAG: DUF1653 domain-containing protein [Bacillota bacterium]